MPAALTQLTQRAFAQFRSLSPGKRVALVGGIVAAVLVLFAFSRLSGRPDMAALYTDLAPADAAAVTERLSAKGVGYELADAGSTIRVPRDRLYQLRLELSADGLPSGGAGGWSILDDQGITTSEFSQRVGYQRALEGELARTVASLDAIQSATVHLVLPERSAFVIDEGTSSASVLVRTRPGKSLSSTQVQAIVNLVSSSVQGLTPDAVTVADTTGNVLSAPGQGVGVAGGAGTTGMEQTSAFESTLATDIEAMLRSVVGPGRVVVTVNADLDFDKSTSTSETFTSSGVDGGPPLADSTSTRTEEYQGAVPGNTGVLGPDPDTSGGSDTSYNLEETSSDNALNRVVETTERAPGAIERLSVAVLVDEGAVTDAQAGEIGSLVTAAAGLDDARGDQLVVTRLPFDTSAAEASEAELAALDAQKAREDRQRLLTTLGAVAVVVVVLLLAYRTATRAQRRRGREPIDLRAELESAADAVEDEVLIGEEALEREPETVEVELPIPELPPTPPTEEELMMARLGSQVSTLVENQPDEVALLLRSWLGDRRTARR